MGVYRIILLFLLIVSLSFADDTLNTYCARVNVTLSTSDGIPIKAGTCGGLSLENVNGNCRVYPDYISTYPKIYGEIANLDYTCKDGETPKFNVSWYDWCLGSWWGEGRFVNGTPVPLDAHNDFFIDFPQLVSTPRQEACKFNNVPVIDLKIVDQNVYAPLIRFSEWDSYRNTRYEIFLLPKDDPANAYMQKNIKNSTEVYYDLIYGRISTKAFSDCTYIPGYVNIDPTREAMDRRISNYGYCSVPLLANKDYIAYVYETDNGNLLGQTEFYLDSSKNITIYPFQSSIQQSGNNLIQTCDIGEIEEKGQCIDVEEEFQILFVPINYKSDDPEFKERVLKSAAFMQQEWSIPDQSFIIVGETMNVDLQFCVENGLYIPIESIEQHAKAWYTKVTGNTLMKDLNHGNFRVVGIDNDDTCIVGACGYAKRVVAEGAYLSGNDCGKGYHVAAHEIGHTFGLCDQYNPYTWDRQQQLSAYSYAFSCQNERPTDMNTKFLGDCKSSPVCTYGVLLNENRNIYTVMGSADLIDDRGKPIIRKFSDKGKGWIIDAIPK